MEFGGRSENADSVEICKSSSKSLAFGKLNKSVCKNRMSLGEDHVSNINTEAENSKWHIRALSPLKVSFYECITRQLFDDGLDEVAILLSETLHLKPNDLIANEHLYRLYSSAKQRKYCDSCKYNDERSAGEFPADVVCNVSSVFPDDIKNNSKFQKLSSVKYLKAKETCCQQRIWTPLGLRPVPALFPGEPVLDYRPEIESRNSQSTRRISGRSKFKKEVCTRSDLPWNGSELRAQVRGHIAFKAACVSVGCSRDMRFVAGGGNDHKLRVVDLTSYPPQHHIAAAAAVTGGIDSLASKTTLKTRVFEGHTDAITCVGFHPDKQLCFSGSLDLTVKVFDLKSRKTATPIGSFDDIFPVTCLSLHPCGGFLYVGTNHPIIRIYDFETRRCHAVLQQNNVGRHAHSYVSTSSSFYPLEYQAKQVRDLQCSSDGSILASANADGSVFFYDAVSCQIINTMQSPHRGMPVESFRWSRSGRYFLTSGLDGQTRIWDIRNGKQILVMGEGVRFLSSSTSVFLQNEAFIVSMQKFDHRVAGENQLLFYNSYTGEKIKNFENPHPRTTSLNALTAAPFEMACITGAEDGKCRILDFYIRTVNVDEDDSCSKDAISG